MEFRETLLAAQRNAQQTSSAGSSFYKARFDPPKKENRPKDKLSANIQKFLAKKEEEEKQKKLEEKRKRDELQAMRDPKAIRKIQKSLKVFRSANKSVIADAVDTEHTAITRDGPLQPDQDDYGYESQESAAIYQKMMEKYSKIPDEPKFTHTNHKTKKDLEGTKERVKAALLQGEEPVPHKRRRRTHQDDKEPSPPPKSESEKKKDEKPKNRKPAPPPMDFNQILKLAEQKQYEQPAEAVPKKAPVESEPERLMTKKQRKEYEEEMARRKRRQERLDAERTGKKVPKEDKPADRPRDTRPEERRDKRPEPSSSGSSGSLGFGRIPKIGEKRTGSPATNDSPKSSIKDKLALEKEKIEKLQREKAKLDKEKSERDKERLDLERLEKLRAERERIERDIERLNKDRDRLEKSKQKLESKSADRPKVKQEPKSIDLKSQNTYRIDKTSDKKPSAPSKSGQHMNGHSAQKPLDKNGVRDKLVKKPGDSPKSNGVQRPESKVPVKGKPMLPGAKPQPSKPIVSNSFDFDKHVNSLKNGAKAPDAKRPPGDARKKMHPDDIRRKQMLQKRRVVDSEDEDSDMDSFIDDGDEDADYSKHIKEIFGYDKSKYRDIDDDDDPAMESSFTRQMHEEYVSKKIGIMEDLEDMRLEKQMKKKKRRISDD